MNMYKNCSLEPILLFSAESLFNSSSREKPNKIFIKNSEDECQTFETI